jgi:hypothetical protein
MADTNLIPEEIGSALQNLLDDANDGRMLALREIVQAGDDLRTGYEEAANRLEASGSGSAAAFAESARSLLQMRDSLAGAADRQARLPRLGPQQGMVHGTVMDAGGAPAPDLQVRLMDPQRRTDVPGVDPATTDQYGDFSLVYSQRPVTADQPALALVVQDASGKDIYTPPDMITLAPGRVDHFEIVLTAVRQRLGPRAGGRRARRQA